MNALGLLIMIALLLGLILFFLAAEGLPIAPALGFIISIVRLFYA